MKLEHATTTKQLAQAYLHHSRTDHRTTLSRKQMIEARKEFIESQSKAKASLWMDKCTYCTHTLMFDTYMCVYINTGI